MNKLKLHYKTRRTFRPDNFDAEKLKERCLQNIGEVFNSSGGEIRQTSTGAHCFKNNGSNILAVAHCDISSAVQKMKHFTVSRLHDETLIFNTALDDRLGVYTILDLLPSMGIKPDILLTENEEIGRNTADDFETDKKYNWIFEFDRSGTQSVTYEYDWNKTVTKYFKNVGRGTFSDICSLYDLGCQGINIGTGYDLEHTSRCYMVIEDYLKQVEKFVKFWNKQSNNRYEFKRPSYVSSKSNYELWGGNYYRNRRGSYNPVTGKSKSATIFDDEEVYQYGADDADAFSLYYWCADCGDYRNASEVYTQDGTDTPVCCAYCGHETIPCSKTVTEGIDHSGETL